MKNLKQYILEKFKISKETQIKKDIDISEVTQEHQDYIESILPFTIETQGRTIEINKCKEISKFRSYKFYSNNDWIFTSNYDKLENVLKNQEKTVWGKDFKKSSSDEIEIKVI